jgi:hypothetical protein
MRHVLLPWLLCLNLLACDTVSDPVVTASAPTATAWSIDRVETSGGLASVWGSGPRDVWAAGGQQGHGLVLHHDGNGWIPIETGAKSFLWWIYGLGADDVYAVGAQGLIQHFDGNAWTTVPSGTTKTLFGLWGASGQDVWIVGGDTWGKAGDAIVLRGNANGFHAVALPEGLLPAAMFKIYGTPAGDVVAVGTSGTVLRYNGTWTRDEVPTTSPLISLWGGGGESLYAVGGEATGIVLYFDGAHWTQVSGVQAGLELYGVFKAPGQDVFAVGAGPRILELGQGARLLESEAPVLDSTTVLHSVWGDGQGTVYAVGGSLYSDPAIMTGVILRRR